MVTIDLLLAAVQASVVLTLLFLAPGLALGRVIAPSATTILGSLGRAAAVSLLTTSLACTLLAMIGALRPTIVLAVLVGLIILPLQASPPRRWRVFPTSPRRWLAAPAAIGVVLVLIVLPSATPIGGAGLPAGPDSWHHGLVAEQTAAAGAIPGSIPAWGGDRTLGSGPLPFTAHAAAAFQLLPGELSVRMELYRLGVLVACAATAALLLRRFVSSWLAALGAVLLLATEGLSSPLESFGPAGPALTLAWFALWLLDRALVERRSGTIGVAVITVAVTLLVQPEVALLLAASAAGIAAARLLVRPLPRGRTARPAPGRRIARPQRLASITSTALVIVAGGLGVGSLGSVAIGGEVPPVGVVDGWVDAAVREPVIVTERPPGWSLSGDPAWDFHVAATAGDEVGREPPRSLADPRLFDPSAFGVWPGLGEGDPSRLAALGGLVVAPLVAWPWLDGRRRRLLVASLLASGMLLATSLLLVELPAGYAPRQLGSRLASHAVVVASVVAVLIGLWGLDRLLRPGWRALLPRRGEGDPLAVAEARSPLLPRPLAMFAAGAFLALITAAMTALPPGGTAGAGVVDRVTATGLEAWRWIAAETPPGSRILANAHTEGVAAAVGQRTGIIDGRITVGMDDRILGEATALLLGARATLLAPDGPDADHFLNRERVDYLLVADSAAGALSGDLGGHRLLATDVAGLDRRHELIRVFGDGALRLYAVRGRDD